MEHSPLRRDPLRGPANETRCNAALFRAAVQRMQVPGVDGRGSAKENMAKELSAPPRLPRARFWPDFDQVIDGSWECVEIGAHEKGFAGALAEQPVMCIDHGPHRIDAGWH